MTSLSPSSKSVAKWQVSIVLLLEVCIKSDTQMDAALDLLISSHLGIIYKCLAFCSIERSRSERLWLFLENHYSKQFSKNETLSVPLFNNTFYKLILYGRTHNKSQKRRCSEYCSETTSNPFVSPVCRLIGCCMRLFHSYFISHSHRKKRPKLNVKHKYDAIYDISKKLKNLLVYA